ncbi:MAG: ribosome recycling factor [Coriobacteriia bacterium]|nr:ribosome recycling factor [Coriobacteriia bacterium]
MIPEILKTTQENMDKTQAALLEQFAGVRTGRASSAILDKLVVDAYGSQMPLNQLANVKTPDAQTLVIEPWDKSTLGAIEKAIMASDLGLSPNNDGMLIRVPFPPLTEERRVELFKLCKQYSEDAKIATRNIRRDANQRIDRLKNDSEIGEDEAFTTQDQIQKLTDASVAKIDDALAAKEKDIMEI